ncbi:P-loop containing nucleoside triphosphate hydrolase protein [Polyplosphaeria fusca]|uniref:P-loop containing nucleoside triphosphate hydrolase protein n=1 Tax=Polyplosphaeria fusca TaxID=682080 RepID=A0A9P4QQR0_9PLEO|nr:P-loop containing nucleoside triphosphate hydrolase protein [Polyplosphaeria fusca]
MSGLADQSADNALWDLILPSLKNAGPLGPSGSDGLETFSVRHLVAAVQHGATANEVNAYISHFSTQHKATVQAQINSDVEGFPAIFYIVGSNDDSIIRAFDKAGADLHATYGDPPVPLLAFAVINSKIIGRDTSSTIATLLSLGADEKSIPKPFYSPFDVDHPEDGPQEEIMLEYLQDARTAWYKRRSTRKLLSEALSITQRYYLYRASQLSKPTGRQKDVAARHSSTELFAIPYFLIGQNAATELLTRSFLRYMLRRQKHPLVLVFAGPSGHGKTELARRLGDLLSLDLNVSDCTIVTRELELFGPRKPYSGAAEGSPLNNFLAAHHGRKCIVFLDEFEKTTQDIWNALLVPFDNAGEYQDRRNLKTIDCKNTIWILATNALDNCITSFCKRNGAIFGTDNSTTRAELLDELTSSMKEKFINVFSAPLTGRISAFVPFLPFSSEETCIGAHKYLLELANEVRKPICITPGPHEHLLGNIRLSIRADATVCKIITRDYDPALGIRSLRKAVTDRVASLLDSEYLATHEIIAEGGPVEDYSVFVSDGKIKVKQISSRPDHA